MKKLDETELGYTIVPSRIEAEVSMKYFVGDPPKVGGWAFIKSGRISFDDGTPSFEWAEEKNELNGNWLIVGVEILEDCLQLKLTKRN